MSAQRENRRRWSVVAAAIACIVAAFGAGWGIGRITESSASAAVTLIPAGSPGPDPFTASVASGQAVGDSAAVRAINANLDQTLTPDASTHTLVAVGTTPGLYGGSNNTRVCDPQQLVGFLQRNPGKARAWAQALGIRPDAIAGYVAGLTPVLLTRDTLVTNHGYHDRAAYPFQAVLQAGTAVLVDATGAPRVKCSCGNPLTPPEPIRVADTTGTPWAGYQPAQITVIRGGTTVNNITVIDIRTGGEYSQPLGGGGAQFVAASVAPAGDSTTISTSPDGTAWTTTAVLPGRVGGLAFGKGKWRAFRATSSGSEVLESADVHTWNPVATISGFLQDTVYADGRWIAVGGEDDGVIGRGVVYASTDGRSWRRVAGLRETTILDSVSYGNGVWIAVTGAHQYGDPSATFRSTDGVTWTLDRDRGLAGQSDGRIAFGSGRWVMGGFDISSGSGNPSEGGTVSISTDARTWTTAPNAPFLHNPVMGVAFGNGQWLAITQDGDQPNGTQRTPSSGFFASGDGKTWTRRGHLDPQGFDIAFGETTAGSATPAETTPTTRAAGGFPGVDFRNYAYPDRVCGTDTPQKLLNGEWRKDPSSTFDTCGMSIDGVDFADITGDGKAEAIVTIQQNASGTVRGLSYQTYVFRNGPKGPVLIGSVSGAAYPPYSASTGVAVWERRYQSADFGCCPSTYQKTTYKYDRATRKLRKTHEALVPASQLPKR